MTEKESDKSKGTSKETKISVTKKKTTAISKPSKKPSAPSTPLDVWQAFNDTFTRFRNDFEDILFPDLTQRFSFIPEMRVPVIDLEDKEKEYVLKAEMPGFKKEDIELEVQDNSITITGTAGWKYDEKGKLYICKERACKIFSRSVELSEEVKIQEVEANLTDGVLEIILPKKMPKQKRKISVK